MDKNCKKALDDWARTENSYQYCKDFNEMIEYFENDGMNSQEKEILEDLSQFIWSRAYTQAQKDTVGFEKLSKANRKLCDMCKDSTRQDTARTILNQIKTYISLRFGERCKREAEGCIVCEEWAWYDSLEKKYLPAESERKR
jgi:hypothetical protein